MDVETFRTRCCTSVASCSGGTAAKPLQWTMENNSGRQGDMADQASGNNEVHIQLKLKQTDAKILQAIEEALRASKRAPTASARIAASRSPRRGSIAIPWTRSCISCKEKQKA